MSRHTLYDSGYLTPDEAPDDLRCRSFSIPNDPRWLGNFMGAIYPLTQPENWRPYGTLTPDEAAAAYSEIFDAGYASTRDTCDVDIQTPFWDEASDVDDSEPADMQPWYGQVTNPTAPAAELDFVENALVWIFTGLIAAATPEIGFAPAILFHTIAPKFIIAQKRGDFAEIIRIVVDGQDAAVIDTSSYSAGDIIETPIIADPALDSHDLLILATPA